MKKIYTRSQIITGLVATIIVVFLTGNLNAQDIIGHPKDVTIFGGYTGSVLFEVDVNPDAKPTFQWFFKEPGASTGKEISGETGPVLEVLFKDPVDPGKWDGVGYYCIVGDLKEESLHAYLWVQAEPKVKVITGHPADVTKETGFAGEINYNVELTSGTEAHIYWFKRIPGTTAEWKEAGTGPQLTETIKELDIRANGTAYRSLVRSDNGDEYSQVAYLWVKEPKKLILTEPVDVYKPEGYTGYVTFDITSGSGDATFQWQIKQPGKIWVDYTGAEKPVFEFPVKEPLGVELDGMAVRCIARLKLITEVSEPAYLHMEEVNKFILVDPEDVMKKQGYTGLLYFAIKYDNSYELKFQWQERKPGGSWVDISSTEYPAYKPELTYPVEKLTSDWNGWSFRCVATDGVDVEYSKEANLYVSLYETYFTGQPKNATVCESAETAVKYAVSVVKDVELTKQWQMSPADDKNWYDIKGADSTLYVKEFKEVPLSYNGYAYRCKVVDQYGGTEFSDIAFLYVRGVPKVTTHPASQVKMVGEAATFNVVASGYKPFTYQWLKDDSPISGKTAASLSLFPLAVSDAGDYSVVVSNVCADPGDTSNAATLTVNAPLFDDGWISQEATGNDFTDIKFAGENTGWFTQTGSPFAYKTANGGLDWATVSLGVSEDWQAVFTTDEDKVWVAGGTLIKYTTNGSDETVTWTDGIIDNTGLLTAFSFNDLYFMDSDTGWAVGGNGNFFYTHDGGANWGQLHSGDVPTIETTKSLNAVHFIDADTGVAVGNSGIILVRRGTFWEQPTSGTTEDLKDVYFVNDLVGWISGANGVLMNTQNGGGNWSLVSVPSSVADQDLNGVHFFDTDHGWVITGNGKILRTNDGGITWYFQESGSSQSLNAVDFADYDNGWIVGNSETILRTAYSGCLLPTVSLFEDKEFCASVSYELVADSFANNVDCEYLWSHGGATTGTYEVTESGKYWVQVTTVCGEQVSDTVNVVLYPLPEPYAGTDQEICNGDSVQLLATGGVVYSWDNEGLLDDPDVQNPKAGPPVGSTDFIVTVTDENLCQNTDTVMVTVYDIPTSTFTAPSAICDGDSAAITYAGSATADANFDWSFDDRSTIMSGEGIGPYGISWDTIGVFTITLLVQENGCSSETSDAEVTVNPIPLSGFTMQATVCGSDEVDITYMGTDSVSADYVWTFDGGSVQSGSDEGPYTVTWATEGTKSISLNVTQDGCESVETVNQIVVAYPYEGTEICVVTLDSLTEKNLIIWERTANVGIASYNIHRQTSTQDVYEKIGDVLFDQLSVFVDSTSEPQKKEHWYKISAVDTCGNESSLSPYHKTIRMQYDADDGDLIWGDGYVIEGGAIGFTSYVIYRGLDSLSLDSIDVVAGNASSYTDTDSPTSLRWYRIAGVMPSACSPAVVIGGGLKASAGPYHHSLSNLDNNKLQSSTGVRDISARNGLRVYPNPFKERISIDYQLSEESRVRIEVFNLLGVRVLQVENRDQLPGTYNYQIRGTDLEANSIYYLRFTVDGYTTVKKLIPAR